MLSTNGELVSEEKIFRNRPIGNKNCLWQQCLLMKHDDMCNRYRGPYIDASYQVSVHCAKGFQRSGLKCEKITDRRTMDQVIAIVHVAFGKVS